MKVVLFGGAFDPPHLGHQQVVQTILNQGLADQVWFVPTFKHAFDKNMSPVEHRIEMLKLALIPQTKIETAEIERKGESKTIDTLRQLSKDYSQHQFSWLIGSDNLNQFALWHDYQEILQEFKVYVYPRAGFEMSPLYAGMVPLANVKQVRISSSQVKKMVGAGQSIQGLVLEKVRQYILTNDLYQK